MSPVPCSYRSTSSSPAMVSRQTDVIRCPRSRRCRTPLDGGASARATQWSHTTTTPGSPPLACGGCSGGRGSTTYGCSTAGSPPGSLPAERCDTDDVEPTPGDVVLASGRVPTIDMDGSGVVRRCAARCRAGERYRGETEPIDPKAGHIPGAVSAPTTDNVDADGRFLSGRRAAEKFAALGVRDGMPVAAYCGSGVTAAHEVAALAIAGFDAALYPGSWSQWSNHDRPVAT